MIPYLVLPIVVVLSLVGSVVLSSGSSVSGSDIIIAAGQSNMVGQGLGKYKYQQPNLPGRILQIEEGTNKLIGAPKDPLSSLNSKDNRKVGPAVQFARLYGHWDLANDRQIIIVPASRGGTAIECWVPPSGSCWKDLVTRTDVAMEQPGDNKVVVFMWQQMETDIINGIQGNKNAIKPAEYRLYLDKIIREVRKRYGKDIIVLAGEPVPSWAKDYDLKDRFMLGSSLSMDDVGRSSVVKTAGLKSNYDSGLSKTDKIHFSADSQMKLGFYYFREFRKILYDL